MIDLLDHRVQEDQFYAATTHRHHCLDSQLQHFEKIHPDIATGVTAALRQA